MRVHANPFRWRSSPNLACRHRLKHSRISTDNCSVAKLKRLSNFEENDRVRTDHDTITHNDSPSFFRVVIHLTAQEILIPSAKCHTLIQDNVVPDDCVLMYNNANTTMGEPESSPYFYRTRDFNTQ